MSITRDSITSKDSGQDLLNQRNEELSSLMKIALNNGIGKDHDLCYKIGLAYYNKKLLEIGNDPIIRAHSHIRNNDFDTHKDNAYLHFKMENYETALSLLILLEIKYIPTY